DLPAWQLALSGGEDYELCFTAPPHAADSLIAAVAEETGTPVTIVGHILPPDQGRQLIRPDGESIPLEPKGWQHFAGTSDSVKRNP
ncbi:MAG: hypothetical protein M3220_01750, partial [Chloroflexota bacterium]|nr:hypothetical protein [Chloroflexota bacterium]